MSESLVGAEQDSISLSRQEIIAQSFSLAAAAHRDGDSTQAAELYGAILQAQPGHADALHGLGVLAHQSGRGDLAETLIGGALCGRDDPTFHNNFALVLLALDRPNEALAAVMRALERRSHYPEAYNALGNIQLKLKLLDEAVASFRRAIDQRPDYADAWCNLGKALQDQALWDEAEQAYAKAIEFNPDCAEAYNNLGNILRTTNKLDRSLECFDKALAIRADFPEALANRAVTLLVAKRYAEATAFAQMALKINPDFKPALNARGSALFAEGRFDEALPFFERAVACDEHCVDSWVNLGGTLLYLNRIDEAIEAYDKSIALADEAVRADTHFTIGTHLVGQNWLDKGLAQLDRALEEYPTHSGALCNRGVALQFKGELVGAVAAYGDVIAVNPDYVAAYCNKLMAMHYVDDFDNMDVLKVARSFGAKFDRPQPPAREDLDLSPDRRLRIGYVSGDFNAHPVAFFLERSLAAHDKANFETFCYSNCATEDYFTAELRGMTDHWRDIIGISDEGAFKLVREDKIDILVDLAGHTNKTRLPLFCLKPAPVQAAWLGYFGTTGVDSMDYLILDPISAPPGTDKFYVEALVRLPFGRFCYKAPPFATEIAEPPVLSKGHVTFGSFNNIAKIGPRVIRLWSAVLTAVPDSRLVLKWRSMSEASVRERLSSAFEREGVARDRLDFRGSSSHEETLLEYADLDIALDPFPFGGATTSCEALWMGVPVVTLPGDRLASRQTLGFLREMGYDELAASSPEDYVARAAALAGDPQRLLALRHALRPAMERAPFCDGPKFTATLEAAYRRMWRRYVSGEKPEPFDVLPTDPVIDGTTP